MPTRIHGIDDLSDEHIDLLLERAAAHADSAAPTTGVTGLVGLGFFESSLRTRVGFEAAAIRLGLGTVRIDERRSSATSVPERLEDTIRVVSGFVDALVVRSARPSYRLAAETLPDRGWLNGGDPEQHPTQAMLDLFAITRLRGAVDRTTVAVVGDPRSRSVRSLLDLLARRPPAGLVLVRDESLPSFLVPEALRGIAQECEPWRLDDVDVLYVAGLPAGALADDARPRLRVGPDAVQALAPGAVILSPMPVVDEIAARVRSDPAMRYFEQSDLGVFMRMALLEFLLGGLR